MSRRDRSETVTETQVRLVLENQARSIGKQIAAACPAGVGFALFLYDFGPDGNLAYIGNGNREDMIHAVEEWLEKVKGP